MQWHCRLMILSTMLLVYGCVASPRFTASDGTVSHERRSISAREDGSLLNLEGVASFYAHDFHGRQTANGEIFDMYALTAAHRSFPFNTRIRVHNLDNGKSVVVRINDRGPFIEGRIIDLSYGAAREIGMLETGIANVRLQIIEWGTSN